MKVTRHDEGETVTSTSRPVSPFLSLARHEMCHAIAALLKGASEACISDDHDTWRTDYRDMPDDEFAVACTWVAALLVPEHMSHEDRFLIAALPPALRERAKDWCDTHVRPVIEGLTDDDLAPIAARVMDGGIVLRRTKLN